MLLLGRRRMVARRTAVVVTPRRWQHAQHARAAATPSTSTATAAASMPLKSSRVRIAGRASASASAAAGSNTPSPTVNAFPMRLRGGRAAAGAAGVQRDVPQVELRDALQDAPQPVSLTDGRPLCRDFIHDSLYHPTHGYFSQRATILAFPRPVDFRALPDGDTFMALVQELYTKYDLVAERDALDGGGKKGNAGDGASRLQVWHTPTELYKPYYGEALARYMVREHLATHSSTTSTLPPLTIYEMGAGNGTLMSSIIAYIERAHPTIYSTMRYNIIEISERLAERQRRAIAERHRGRVRIVNESVLEWRQRVDDECFFIALEVIDNFAHDAIRYEVGPTTTTAHAASSSPRPLQTRVAIDPLTKDYVEEFEPVSDPLIARYLAHRRAIARHRAGRDDGNADDADDALAFAESPLLRERQHWWSRLRAHLPLAANLTRPEFVPTMSMVFMEMLHEKFPRHRLILSDFDTLPTSVEGINAPVVQTRQKGIAIPTSTYMVARGWFDIFFPTDFNELRAMYEWIGRDARSRHVGGKGGARRSRIVGHGEFLAEYGDVEATTTRSGENPMLGHYTNVKFFLS